MSPRATQASPLSSLWQLFGNPLWRPEAPPWPTWSPALSMQRPSGAQQSLLHAARHWQRPPAWVYLLHSSTLLSLRRGILQSLWPWLWRQQRVDLSRRCSSCMSVETLQAPAAPLFSQPDFLKLSYFPVLTHPVRPKLQLFFSESLPLSLPWRHLDFSETDPVHSRLKAVPSWVLPVQVTTTQYDSLADVH